MKGEETSTVELSREKLWVTLEIQQCVGRFRLLYNISSSQHIYQDMAPSWSAQISAHSFIYFVYLFHSRGAGYNQIFELSFWHPGGTTAHKNKTLSENQKFLASNLPPTPTQNVWDKWLKIAQNTKGGPLDEKIFFAKKFSDLDHSRLIFSDFSH